MQQFSLKIISKIYKCLKYQTLCSYCVFMLDEHKEYVKSHYSKISYTFLHYLRNKCVSINSAEIMGLVSSKSEMFLLFCATCQLLKLPVSLLFAPSCDLYPFCQFLTSNLTLSFLFSQTRASVK